MTTPVQTMPLIRYPDHSAEGITPHGSHYIKTGKLPNVQLRAYDDTIWWDLMGGRSIPNRAVAPESVQVKKDGIKGLVPPWQTIDQKGATEDGVHFVDALYDPIEVTLGVSVKGRNNLYLAKTVNDLISSIDVKQTSQFSWFSNRAGFWWTDLRWFKTPPDTFLIGGQSRRQDLTLILRADNGFWRTYNQSAGFAGAGTAFLEFTNPGDQDVYPRFTCFGPGTFKFADGPGSTNMVQFGPLLPGQVAQIRTDPRKRGVVDLTQKPPSLQEQQQFAQAMVDLKSFTQVLGVFQSIFGILGTGPVPPQGNLYSLLKGRFSDRSAILAKSPGRPATPQKVKIEVSGAGAQTLVAAAITPLRRMPF